MISHLRLAALLLLLPTAALAAPLPAPVGGLSVLAVDPARHAIGASTAAPISITFDAPLAPASLSPASVRVYGTWSGVVPGTLSLGGGGTTLTFQPARPYFAGELVSVILSESISGSGGATLAGGHGHTFWAGSAHGTGQFSLAEVIPTRFEGEGPVQSYGIHAGDLDGDGAPDFSIPNEIADDVRVLLNDGCGRLGEPRSHTLAGGATPSANTAHDLNRDGVMDLVTANVDGNSVSVLMGDGEGGYMPPVDYASGLTTRGVAALDADGDGHVDLVAANRSGSDLSLFINLGDGTFAAAISIEAGGNGETAVTATDANNDGFTDLFVAHFFSHSATLLLGDGNGGFTLSADQPVGLKPWKNTAGDVNGDGNVDFITADTSSATLTVLLGDGLGGMTVAATLPVGGFPTSIVTGDIDGDGDLDLVSSDVAGSSWTCYLNTGGGAFTESFTLPAILAGSCATLVDYDRDGFVDIVGVDEISDNVMIWKQSHLALFGTQQPSCSGTLRINNLAGIGGFGAQPPHDVGAGDTFFLGVSTTPEATWVLGAGLPLWPGLPSAFGLFNLSPPPLLLFSLPSDAKGESMLPLAVPPSTPPGLSIALQVFVDTARGWRATNPEVVRTTP